MVSISIVYALMAFTVLLVGVAFACGLIIGALFADEIIGSVAGFIWSWSPIKDETGEDIFLKVVSKDE